MHRGLILVICGTLAVKRQGLSDELSSIYNRQASSSLSSTAVRTHHDTLCLPPSGTGFDPLHIMDLGGPETRTLTEVVGIR